MFTISVEGDEVGIRRILSYTPFSFVSADYQLWFCSLVGHSLAKDGRYLECAATIPVRYGDKIGGFSPYMYCTCVEAILAGREVFGYPKRWAQMEWLETPQAICTCVKVDGHQLLDAAFVPDGLTVGEVSRIEALENMTKDRLIHKSVPDALKNGSLLHQIIYRDLARKSGQAVWGRAFVEMKHVDGHMVDELGIKKILGAKYTLSSYGGGIGVETREVLNEWRG